MPHSGLPQVGLESASDSQTGGSRFELCRAHNRSASHRVARSRAEQKRGVLDFLYCIDVEKDKEAEEHRAKTRSHANGRS